MSLREHLETVGYFRQLRGGREIYVAGPDATPQDIDDAAKIIAGIVPKPRLNYKDLEFPSDSESESETEAEGEAEAEAEASDDDEGGDELDGGAEPASEDEDYEESSEEEEDEEEESDGEGAEIIDSDEASTIEPSEVTDDGSQYGASETDAWKDEDSGAEAAIRDDLKRLKEEGLDVVDDLDAPEESDHTDEAASDVEDDAPETEEESVPPPYEPSTYELPTLETTRALLSVASVAGIPKKNKKL